MSEEIDLDARQLCPDGACIGVIGPNGRCKVCGRPGDPSQAVARTSQDAEPDLDLDLESDGTEAAADAAADPDSGFDDDRQLCADESCIGVIGPDGKCKVCGQVLPGS